MARTDEASTSYDTATVGDVRAPADLGATVLVTGPTLSNKDAVAFDLFGDGWTDARPFAITATDPAAAFRDRLRPYVPAGRRAEDVYVIDCLEVSNSTDSDDPHTHGVGTPADLTGIGIALSKGYERYGTGQRRVLLDNLATLLVYSDIDRVYRFVDVVTSRLTDLGNTSVHLLDGDTVEGTDRNKLIQLFSAVIEVRSEGDTTLFRVRDGTGASEWYEHTFRGEGR